MAFRWQFVAALAVLLLVGLGVQAPAVVAQAVPGTAMDVSPAGHGFIENRGQWDAAALFHLEANGLDVWLTQTGFRYQAVDLPVLQAKELKPVTSAGPQSPPPGRDAEVNAHAVFAEYVGASPTAVEGLSQLPGYYNFLVGAQQKWASYASQYQTVVYRELYPGIDAYFTALEESGLTTTDVVPASPADAYALEVTYAVAPGADPAAIRIRYEGANSLRINGSGELVMGTSLAEIRELLPLAYQITEGGQRRAVGASFVLNGNEVGFEVSGYDPEKTVYIDPIVIFSRSFGGTGSEGVWDMHEDATGRYFTGLTASTNFPVTAGAYRTSLGGSLDWYAAKFNLANTTLLWATYIGSSGSEGGGASALRPDGQLVLSGSTASPWTGDFPWVFRYFNTAYPPTGFTYSWAVALFRLSADGASRVSAAWFSGPLIWYGGGVNVAANGDVYVTGTAQNLGAYPWTNLGSTGGGFRSAGVGTSYDAFVSRFNADFSSYLNATVIPADTSSDGGGDIAFDSAGNVYNWGFTIVSAGWLGTHSIGPGGGYDLYVAKYNAALTSQFYATKIGGASTEPTPGWSYTSNPDLYFQTSGESIRVDAANQAWVVGMSASTDWPTTAGAYSTTHPGNYAVTVFCLNSAGSAPVYSTFIGGTSTDLGRGIDWDSRGLIYVGGATASTNYPTRNAEQATNAGGYDFVRSIFNSTLSTLICSTYWGGSGSDFGQDIAVHRIPTEIRYRARVAGHVTSPWKQVPTGAPVFGGGGSYDGGVVDLNCGGALLSIANESIVPIPKTHAKECLAAGDVARFIFDVVNTGLSDQPDNAGPEMAAVFTGPMIPYSCTASSGVCTLSGASVEWNGSIPSGGSVNFVIEGRVKGGVPAGTEVCVAGELRFDPGSGVNEATKKFELCTETDCPPTVAPERQLGKEVHLPILNFQGQEDVCRTWIQVQNIGSEYNKAILMTWGEPGFCPPQCSGPLKVECSGLLKPGSTWNFMGAQLPTGSKSGMVFQFSAKQLSKVGVDLGYDDIVADVMCETLFFGVVGDCDDYRRFKKAYIEGKEFAGIPMNDKVKGAGILAVDVLRHCPGDPTSTVEVSSKYNGIAAEHLGKFDPVFGGYAFYVPLLYADKAGFNSVMYIQNGGLECTSVEIWFKAQDDCLRARICEIFTLAPGETYQFDATECVGPDWQGSAWLRSTQPMAIAVDIIGRDVLMTYIGEPAQLNYTFDPNNPDAWTMGNQVAYGPLIYSEYQGWDSGIQVQNLSSVTAAKVKVYFLDRSGDVITTLVDWICPRGSQTFFLPVVHNMPGNWVGSVRVESQEWWTPGDPQVLAPYIVGVVTLIKYDDAARTNAVEAIAYNLLPEHKAFDWQLGFGGGGLDSGIGLIAIPSLLKDLDGTGVTTEVAIANLVPKPGFTDFAIFIYDQNGLLDFVCQKLNEKQVEYIDLQSWGFVNPGFKGSAIISATFWEHDVLDDTGFFLRNLVGLGAVLVERTGTSLGEQVPGDEAAGDRGIPFRLYEEKKFKFTFDWEGPARPLCPGLPDLRPKPGEGPRYLCPPTELSGTYTQGSPDWQRWATWGPLSTRIFRDGNPSNCQPPKSCPSTLSGGGNIDAYYFDNPDGIETCVEVQTTHDCGVNSMNYSYRGWLPVGSVWGCDYDNDGQPDYLGDCGQSGSPQRHGFTIPAGIDKWTLVYANVFNPQVCNYRSTIRGFACQP